MNRREWLGRVAGVAAALTSSGAPRAQATGVASERSDMIARKIPSTGERVPVIGLGTSGPFEVGAAAAARAPLREVIDAFFEGGGRLIDTSPMYSTAERVLGELLSPAQQQACFMATKVWEDGADAGVSQLHDSARLLKHRPLDLIQVHNLRDLAVQLATLRAWKAEGKVRYIGVTHYTIATHAELARVIRQEKPDFVQFNYSPVTTEAEEKLLPLCADKGVAVLVNRAFEDGKLFAQVRGKAVPDWAAEFGATSWAQVFLKYVIANPAVTCVIPATGKLRNMLDNLAAGRGELPNSAQRARIVAALA